MKMFMKKISLVIVLAAIVGGNSFQVMAAIKPLGTNEQEESDYIDILPLTKVIPSSNEIMQMMPTPDGRFLVCLERRCDDEMVSAVVRDIGVSFESVKWGTIISETNEAIKGKGALVFVQFCPRNCFLKVEQGCFWRCLNENCLAGFSTLRMAKFDLMSCTKQKEGYMPSTRALKVEASKDFLFFLTNELDSFTDDGGDKTLKIINPNQSNKVVKNIDLGSDITSLCVASRKKMLFCGFDKGLIKVLNINPAHETKKLGDTMVNLITGCNDDWFLKMFVTPNGKFLIVVHKKTSSVGITIDMLNINTILSQAGKNKKNKVDYKPMLSIDIGSFRSIQLSNLIITPDGKNILFLEYNNNINMNILKAWDIDETSENFGKKISETALECDQGCKVNNIFVTKKGLFGTLCNPEGSSGCIYYWELPTCESLLFSKVKFEEVMEPTKSGSHEKINVKDLRDIKIHFDPIYTSKTNNKSKLIEKKETGQNLPLQTVSELDDLLKNLLVFTQTQKEMLKKEINDLLKDNQEQTSSSFIELIKSVEYLFSSATTLVEVYSINKIGIINFVEEKCLETLKLSLQKIASILSTHGVRSTFFSQKSQAIQEALKKNMKELLETYKNFTAKTGKDVLGLNELVASVEANFNKYIEKAEKKDDLIIKKD